MCSIETKSCRPRIMNKDDGEVVIRWLMKQDTYFCKQRIEKSSRDLINFVDAVGTVWKSGGISVTIKSLLNRFEDRGIQIPYILESNPHPNPIRTQFLAIS